jgi:hypothetical protein
MQRSCLEHLVHGVARAVQGEPGEAQFPGGDRADDSRLSSSSPVWNISIV